MEVLISSYLIDPKKKKLTWLAIFVVKLQKICLYINFYFNLNDYLIVVFPINNYFQVY